MKRCVVQFRDGSFANIEADSLVENDALVFVFDNGRLVGVFDLSAVLAIYLSEVKK